MAYHNINRHALGLGRRPSSRHPEYEHASPTMSSSRRASNGMSYLQTSPGGHQQSNSHYYQSPENASYQDGATPQVITPCPDEDVMNMQDPAPFAESPRLNNILGSAPQFHPSAHAFRQNTGYSPPWNGLKSDKETSDEMFNSMIDQNVYLTVPDKIRSPGTGETRGSTSTVGTAYTASSDGRSDADRERTEPRRGGRQPGSRLPEAGVQNVRVVRDTGACIRCRILRMKCSGVTPCETCATLQNGRKWGRCLRSFSEMAELLKPVILAERLHFDNMREWITQHAYFPPGHEKFELPLSFGFGEIFEGLRGVEYNPTSYEAQRSDAIGYGDQPQMRPGIAVCPVYESHDTAQRLIWKWLKRTLTSAQSMSEWFARCSEVVWIQTLLQSTWEYSVTCWYEGSHLQRNESTLDHNLLKAWMAALLVTMLSLPVTIPKQAVHNIGPRLRYSSYNEQHSNTSRALTRAVKALFFDMYRQIVDSLTSALRDFERLKSEEVTDRRLAHIHCIAILVIVITCQIQTSLMDNAWLSSLQAVDLTMWEMTCEHVRDAECAFRNTIMFVEHNNKRWLKSNTSSNEESHELRRRIKQIERTYHDAINRHRKVDLESLITSRSDDGFHESNMQRVFAFFFDLVRKERSSQVA